MARRSTGNAATFSPAGRGRSRKSRQPIAAAGSSRNEFRNAPRAAPQNTAGDGNTVPAVATRRLHMAARRIELCDSNIRREVGARSSEEAVRLEQAGQPVRRQANTEAQRRRLAQATAWSAQAGSLQVPNGRRPRVAVASEALSVCCEMSVGPRSAGDSRCAIADVASNWKAIHTHARFRGCKSRSTKFMAL